MAKKKKMAHPERLSVYWIEDALSCRYILITLFIKAIAIAILALAVIALATTRG